jgi:hypothetical protein
MNQIAIMESKIEVLGKQVDDLKCCGNCECREVHKGRVIVDMREYCLLHGMFVEANHYCDNWTPDGLARKDRE